MVAAPENPTTAPVVSRIKGRRAEGRTLIADRPLNPGEMRFAQLRAQGWPLAKCYAEVSGAKKRATCENQGWRWQLRPAVMAEIQRQRALLTDATAASRTEKRNVLANLMRDDRTPAAVRVSAIETDNKMTGDNEPVRVSVSQQIVFVCDPIGDGTRGQKRVSELGPDALDSAASVPALPSAPDLTSALPTP